MFQAADAFVKYLTGGRSSLYLDFVKEFPKPETKLSLNFSSLLGPLFFMWLIQLLFPVSLSFPSYQRPPALLWVQMTSVTAFWAGDSEGCSIWEAAEPEDNDEDAWTWG